MLYQEMLNLKKQLLEAEFSREDQLWGKNEELVQMKYEEVAAMKEVKIILTWEGNEVSEKNEDICVNS